MPEETQAGPCAELTKALEACLAENVSYPKMSENSRILPAVETKCF